MDLTPQRAERLVLPKTAEGDAAFQELRAAIEREDWPATDLPARQSSDACAGVSLYCACGVDQPGSDTVAW